MGERKIQKFALVIAIDANDDLGPFKFFYVCIRQTSITIEDENVPNQV